MSPSTPASSIHFRRRWWYAAWVVLLLGSAGFWGWWETPSRTGLARFTLALRLRGAPAGTRGALWIGPTASWRPERMPLEDGPALQGEELVFATRDIPLAYRRLSQGLLLRRTHDLAVVRLRTPSGELRWLVYDLRDDLGGALDIGRRLTVEVQGGWAGLSAAARIPPDAQRRAVGH